jgi:hypothetical protein
VVLNFVGHVSKGLAEVGTSFVRQQTIHCKTFNIENPISSSKILVLSNQDATLLPDTSMHTLLHSEGKKKAKKIKNKNEVSARPVTTAILLLRYPEGQPYYAYARNLHHRHRFDKESPVFAIYTQQVQLLQ